MYDQDVQASKRPDVTEDPELRGYQEQAVDFIKVRKRGGLFLDMGLGKTAISLCALTEVNLPALVVAPKRVAENVWTEEVETWRPDLTIRVAAGRPQDRLEALESDADIVVIGRDNIADAVPFARKFKTLILDELSGFKSRGSTRWKLAKKISVHSEYLWGLTGSPTPNGLLDLWSQLFLIDGGKRLGRTLTEYRTRYFYAGRSLSNGVVTEWILRPGAEEKIYSLIEDVCISMESEGRVDLPPTTFNEVSVPLSSDIMRMYKKLKRELIVDLKELVGGEIHTASNAAILSGKMSQFTSGFLYVDDADLRGGKYDVIHREKIKATREIVDGTGSPVLVFYRFRAELEALLKEFGTSAHTTEEPSLQKRWNNGEFPVLLAHPASAGHGLNLQTGPGRTIVWQTLPWSLEEWKQGNRRIARPGQKNPVIIHTLTSPGTIDPYIKQRLTEKESVEQALLDHLESPL